MTRRSWSWTAAAACLALAAAGLLWQQTRGADAATPPPATTVAAEPVADPSPVALPPASTAPEPAPKEDVAMLQRRLEEADRPADADRLFRRMDEVARQEQAIARWNEGIEREELEARHVEPAVQRFFGDLELEPVLLEGGLMEGLAIQRVAGDGAAARAGLEPGDVIVRLLDRDLVDPAELPDLLARLPRRLPLCVERRSSVRCMEVELD